jgi:hypothetical protein
MALEKRRFTGAYCGQGPILTSFIQAFNLLFTNVFPLDNSKAKWEEQYERPDE